MNTFCSFMEIPVSDIDWLKSSLARIESDQKANFDKLDEKIDNQIKELKREFSSTINKVVLPKMQEMEQNYAQLNYNKYYLIGIGAVLALALAVGGPIIKERVEDIRNEQIATDKQQTEALNTIRYDYTIKYHELITKVDNIEQKLLIQSGKLK